MRMGSIAAACLASSVCLAVPALAEDASGTGVAPFAKGGDGVRQAAEQGARLELARSMVRAVMGESALDRVSAPALQRLASSITPSMFTGREGARVGNTYSVTFHASFDRAWVTDFLDNEGVETAASAAGDAGHRIMVMIDTNYAAARDLNRPQSVVTQYDHDSGGHYSDTSVAASSVKDRSGATARSASASRYSGAGAYGVDGPYGSAAGRYRASGADASSSQSAYAASHSAASIDKTDIHADAHDVTHYRQEVRYQTSPVIDPSDATGQAITMSLSHYGIGLASNQIALSTIGNSTYAALQSSPRFGSFLATLSAQGIAPYFMGGALTIVDGGPDAATGTLTCSGKINAVAFATSNSQQLASAQFNGSATGSNADACGDNLRTSLAAQAAEELGGQLQRYWRRTGQRQADGIALQQSPAGGVYAVTLRMPGLTMKTQADFYRAVSSMQGVSQPSLVAQRAGQLDLQVRYAGGIPLSMALGQALGGNPTFANLQSASPTAQSVMLCAGSCGAGL